MEVQLLPIHHLFYQYCRETLKIPPDPALLPPAPYKRPTGMQAAAQQAYGTLQAFRIQSNRPRKKK